MVTVTNDQLDEAIQAYNDPAAAGGHEAPVQISHDDKVPAQAWISRVYRSGNLLLADYKQPASEFVEALAQGRWKKRSVSFYLPGHPNNPTPGKWNIRHLAYVHVPAVKNLANHGEPVACFSEPEPNILNADFTAPVGDVSFMEWSGVQAFNLVLKMFRAQRENVIAASGIEAADKIFPEESLTALAEILSGSISEYVSYEQLRHVEDRMDARLRSVIELFNRKFEGLNMGEPNATPATPVGGDNTVQMVPMAQFQELSQQVTQASETIKDLQTQLSQYTEIAKTLQTENTELKATNAKLGEQCTQLTQYTEEILQARARERVTAFVESMISQGKVHSSDKQGEVDMILTLDDSKKTEYSEGGETVERTQRGLYMRRLEKRQAMFSVAPMQVDLSEPLPAHNGSEPQTATAVNFTEESERNFVAINKYMADNSVSMTEAIDALGIQL